MLAMTYFYQECPVCGRSLRIPVKYFGREMACTHCHGQFQAGRFPREEPPGVDARVAPSESGYLAHSRFGTPQLGEV